MMIRKWLSLGAVVGLAALGAMSPAQADPGPNWDNLVQVQSKKLKLVYLLPGADFRPYTKVMIDPTEVDFVKGWVRKMNDEYDFSMGQTSDRDALDIAKKVRSGFDKIWAGAFTKAGYQVVTAPGPDVLRVSTAVFNLSISAPYTVTDAQSSVRTVDAGQASLLLQVRDSETGAVLGRALDAQYAGTNDEYMARNITTNEADFGRMFARWADVAVKGMAELKALSPIDKAGQPAAK